MTRGHYGYYISPYRENQNKDRIYNRALLPLFSTNIATYVNAATQVYQDVGGTIPAGIGDTVRRINDLHDAAHAFTEDPSRALPSLVQQDGIPALYFATAGALLGNQAKMIYETWVVFKMDDGTWAKYGGLLGRTSGTRVYLTGNPNSFYNNPYPRYVERNGVSLNSPFNLGTLTTFVLARIGVASPSVFSNLALAHSSGYSTPGMIIAAIVAYDRDLTPSEATEVRAWFAAVFPGLAL